MPLVANPTPRQRTYQLARAAMAAYSRYPAESIEAIALRTLVRGLSAALEPHFWQKLKHHENVR